MLSRFLLAPRQIAQVGRSRLVALRRFSTEKAENPEDTTTWLPVYRYRRIQVCQLLARAKFLQTVASTAYCPYSYWQYCSGAVDAVWLGTTVGLAVAAPLLLAIFSSYLNRLVGVIAVSEDSEWVRFGYLTFWGRRQNVMVRIDDLLPISETTAVGHRRQDKVVKLCWYGSSGSYLFLPTTDCDILDADRARLLFGSNSALFSSNS